MFEVLTLGSGERLIVDLRDGDVRPGRCVVSEEPKYLVLVREQERSRYMQSRIRTSVSTTTMPVLTGLASLVEHTPVTRHAIICAFGGLHGILADAIS